MRLHTLRVLHGSADVRTAGLLLARLPRLRCLQLRFHSTYGLLPLNVWDNPPKGSEQGGDEVLEYLAPLRRTTQLEALYLWGPCVQHQEMAALLPPSLKRLSWELGHDSKGHDSKKGVKYNLSHLKHLTFLQLHEWGPEPKTISQLPPGLRQLEVAGSNMRMLEVVAEQRQVVTAWDIEDLEEVQQLLRHVPNLRAVTVAAAHLTNPAARAALQQQRQLLSLTFNLWHHPRAAAACLPAAVTTAASMRGLRRLHLCYGDLSAPPPALHALPHLTQLTQLRVAMKGSFGTLQQQQHRHHAWAEVLGRMTRLQWLSVPDVLLAPGQAGLGGLQRLRVLVVRGTPYSSLPWLRGCTQQVLPPQLQVLGMSGLTAAQAAAWQARRRLQRLLGNSSGCDVVVGVDLDEVADPTQQLAGLPAALQQALA